MPHVNTSPVVLIAGPTASGKTGIAVELARLAGAEIVSADSRQVYRYLDIGTAKPTLQERGGVNHHGFDLEEPDEVYSAGRFANEARGWIADIFRRGKRVIVTGGSGLYLQALVDGFFGDDIKDDKVRSDLNKRVDREGLRALFEELHTIDPEYAAKTLPHDRQRILRALEVYHASGSTFGELHRSGRDPASFESRWYGLDWPREELYRRIELRVDEMLDRGLIAEVQGLLDRGWRDANALKSMGYQEIVDYLEGRLKDIEDVREAIKRNTRRYAKRQLTWFRNESRICWISMSGKSLLGVADRIFHDAG